MTPTLYHKIEIVCRLMKVTVRTLASPQRQRSHWGLRVTQDAYLLLFTHTKQLLLVTVCDTLAGIEVRFGWTEPRKHRWTDRRGSRKSYLDVCTCNYVTTDSLSGQFG